MKLKTLFCCLTGLLAFIASLFFAPGQQLCAAEPDKAFIVYFSQSGHTQRIAEDISKLTGAKMLRIEREEPYPDSYNQLTEVAKAEQQQNARPKIQPAIPNLSKYDIIFLGFPNWWSSMPMPVYTFIEQAKLNGKTIAPFSTHGGGGLGHSIDDLKKLCPDSKILKPLSISGSRSASASQEVAKWLSGLNLAK